MIDAIPVTPGQPQDFDGPVFKAPWEASAFAMAVKLSQAGHFTWPEWVETFASVIAAHAHDDHDHHPKGHGDHGHAHDDHDDHHAMPDAGSAYYHMWFEALEQLLSRKGILETAALDARHRHLRENPVPHDHVARREPVCVA